MSQTAESITIVDLGRGLQLSTSRVTVQDLVPYFQSGCSYREIIQWIPTLTEEEVAVVDRYYQQHRTELDEQDHRIREHAAARKNPEWVQAVLAEARSERLAIMENLRRQHVNGAAK